MTKDEVLKLAQDACPYKSEELRGAFYEGFIKALDHVPDTTKIIEPDMGIDRGAWDDVPDATKWVDELRGGDETEQEPVAFYVYEWRNSDGRGVFRSFRADEHQFGRAPDSVIPVPAQPPKQEFVCSTGLCHYKHWVGLTDEEIEQLGDKHLVNTPKYIGSGEYVYFIDGETDFARAIEQRLKEKNT